VSTALRCANSEKVRPGAVLLATSPETPPFSGKIMGMLLSPVSACSVLAAALALLLPSSVTGAVPCDGYWLVEESDAGDYSKLDVASLGFQTNRSVCTNADDSLAGKAVSLDRYLAATHGEVTQAMRAHLLPRVRGGGATRQLVIQDLE